MKRAVIAGYSRSPFTMARKGVDCPACSIPFPIYSKEKKLIGKITSGIYSPKFKKNIGLSMILNEFCKTGSEVLVHTPDNKLRKGIVSSLPFSK